MGTADELPMPWVALRFLVAREFHRFPWEIDQAPLDEVLQTLRLMALLPRGEHG